MRQLRSQAFLSLGDRELLAHLQGRVVVGIYPLLPAVRVLHPHGDHGAWRGAQRHVQRQRDEVAEAAVGKHVLAREKPERERSIVGSSSGDSLVDGANAVPLATDPGGARAGNVEADMVLLVRRNQDFRLLLVEVKVASNHAWYAAVENLRQLKLFLESAAPRAVFHRRLPDFCLRDDLPITAVVLAPEAFYTAEHQKAAAVAPARRLLQRMSDEVGLDAVLATWSLSSRAIETYTAG